ncbi:uncharacterized protein V1513DRAFT_436001 [Lipomyces chichibuensis]|uniref:uncharacterized protein n=1 Tax=Lipomyces chichibuensis TaxID=1546026 RepID=UPI0033431598
MTGAPPNPVNAREHRLKSYFLSTSIPIHLFFLASTSSHTQPSHSTSIRLVDYCCCLADGSMWKSSKLGPLRATLLSALLIAVIIVLTVSYRSLMSTAVDIRSATYQAALAKHAHNSSLGFGEIVYISMPSRTDRQDAMNLLSASFDIKIKFIAGVNGSEISPKAIPDQAPSDIRPSVLGCWRAHANAWRYLLETNLETLLIFEDDLDWNPNVKRTLETLSMQMQNSKIRLNEPSDYERRIAPYGLDWDVLYLGSWRHGGNPDFKQVVQKWDDPDVPDISGLNKGKYGNIAALRNFGLTDEEIGKMRVLAPAYWTMHTTGYAITRRGAQRLLFQMSYLGDMHGDVDVEITRLFREGKLRGYSLTPPAFSQFKVSGYKDSDNIVLGKTTQGYGNLNGVNNNIKGSARQTMVDSLNLDNWKEYDRLREEE